MKKIKIIPILISVFSIFFLMGCSDDSLHQLDEGALGKGKDVPQEEIVEKESTDKTYKIGDLVECVFPLQGDSQNIGLTVKVDSAKMVQSLEEIGIGQEDLIDMDIYNNAGEPYFQSPDLERYSVLSCDLTIHNKSTPKDETTISKFTLVSIGEDNEVKIVSHPTYFSKSSYLLNENTDISKYYQYSLNKDEEMSTTVVWLIDTTEFEISNLYLCTSYMGESPEYIYLDLQD